MKGCYRQLQTNKKNHGFTLPIKNDNHTRNLKVNNKCWQGGREISILPNTWWLCKLIQPL